MPLSRRDILRVNHMRSMMNKKNIWKLFYLFNWAVIAFFWFKSSGYLFSEGPSSMLIAFGRLAGFVGAYMILLQFFLMGRMPWLEGVFGLDVLSRVHQANGKWGIVFLILHGPLLSLGYSGVSGVSVWAQFLDFIQNYDDVFEALIGLILFLVVVVTSLYIVRSRVRYEAWYAVHLIAYLAVFFSFGHQIEVGSSLTESSVFYLYWVGLYAVVFASHIVFRFIRPTYFFMRHRFEVVRVVRESPTAVSVYMTGQDLLRFPVKPGQFMIFRFFAKGFWWQAHPFSLSKVPHGNELRITVKELGDFTERIKDLPVGTKVFIDGPYGVFTDLFGVSSKVLFVAGGIGITPIRSLMEEMLAKGKNVVLLYGNKTANDIVFKGELDELSQRYGSRILYVVSDDPAYGGEKGRIDEEKVRRLVPDYCDREVYVCGPVPMMDSVIALVKKLGVDPVRIHYEKFSF